MTHSLHLRFTDHCNATRYLNPALQTRNNQVFRVLVRNWKNNDSLITNMFGYFQMAWYRNLTGRFCGVVSRSIYELRRILTSLLHTKKKKKQKETNQDTRTSYKKSNIWSRVRKWLNRSGRLHYGSATNQTFSNMYIVQDPFSGGWTLSCHSVLCNVGSIISSRSGNEPALIPGSLFREDRRPDWRKRWKLSLSMTF